MAVFVETPTRRCQGDLPSEMAPTKCTSRPFVVKETCPGCGCIDADRVLHGLEDRLFRMTRRSFELHECRSCSLRFLSPMPAAEELAACYPKGYWVGPTRGLGGLGTMLEVYRRFALRSHGRFVRSALLEQKHRGAFRGMLDVGCGDGSVLATVGEVRAKGIDRSAEALACVRQRGFETHEGTLDDAPWAEGSFSLITAFHFLEHVADVKGTLLQMRRLLTDDGEIVLQVPNCRSLQARLLGRFWAGYDVPRHLVDFDDRTLAQLLGECGFEIVRTNHHCLRDNPTTLVNSLLPSLYPPARVARRRSARGAAALVANLAYFGATLLATPWATLESWLGRGASIMVRAKRV